jgi:MH1 domain
MFFTKKTNLRKRLWRSRVTTTTANSPRQQQRPEPYFQQNQHNYQYLSNETSGESYYYPQSQQENVACQRMCGAGRDEGSSLLSTTTAVLRNCCSNSNSSSIPDVYASTSDQHFFNQLMKQIKKESQLETLCQAIECGLQNDGKAHQYQKTDCVLVPRGSINGEEQVIACRLWRWSDLYDCHAIKRIPSCPNEKDPVYVCCNPAHWSRIYHLGKIP